jgi:NAD(P)-dependent dehydrogenase (short-subunit alcohol dehydrogenase family)
LETAKGTGVTCNAICPGYMFTALVQNQLEDTARIRGISKVLHISRLWHDMADKWEGRRFALDVWFATS